MKTLNKIALVALTVLAVNAVEAGCRGGRCGVRRPAVTRRAAANRTVATKKAVRTAKPAPRRRGGCANGRCGL